MSEVQEKFWSLNNIFLLTISVYLNNSKFNIYNDERQRKMRDKNNIFLRENSKKKSSAN